MSTTDRNAFLFGSGIGLTAAAVMFLTIPAYHDFLIWTWSQPLLWLIGVPVGAAVAVITD
jgi:hypothetical protein